MKKSEIKKSKKSMAQFLSSHERYNTMNSWNQSTSYSACVKIPSLNIPEEDLDTAYEVISACENPEIFKLLESVTREFGNKYANEWQIGFNGKSGGYLVLYSGGQKLSEYKSVCTECGQKSVRAVRTLPLIESTLTDTQRAIYDVIITQKLDGDGRYPWKMEVFTEKNPTLPASKEDFDVVRAFLSETSPTNKCGRCGSESRFNLPPQFEVFTKPGLGIDHGMEEEDFMKWSLSRLKERIDIVYDFDLTVEEMKSIFIEFCQTYQVVEEEVIVTKKIKVCQPKG